MYVPMFMFYFLLTVLMTAAYPTETVWIVLAIVTFRLVARLRY